MRSLRMFGAGVALLGLFAMGCGGSGDNADSASTSESTTSVSLPVDVEVTEDVPYTSEKNLDVYAPAEGSDWPVVVYYHGGDPSNSPDRNKLNAPQAQAIAEQGVVVYLPRWSSNGPSGGSQDSVCAAAFAVDDAENHGGDPENLTLAGYSTGGFSAVIHGFVADDPPLPVTDCLVDPKVDLPRAVAAGGGPYFVVDAARQGLLPQPEWQGLTPAQLDALDPYLAIESGKNPELQIVLVVGEEDEGGTPGRPIPIHQSNLDLDAALQEAGYDVTLTELPGGHLEPQNGETEQFDAWIGAIVDAAHGEAPESAG